jgi:hypothetical protein
MLMKFFLDGPAAPTDYLSAHAVFALTVTANVKPRLPAKTGHSI